MSQLEDDIKSAGRMIKSLLDGVDCQVSKMKLEEKKEVAESLPEIEDELSKLKKRITAQKERYARISGKSII